MSIWQDSNGGLHDDMGGAALTLPSWPQGMTKLTAAQAVALQNPPLTLAQKQGIVWDAIKAFRDFKKFNGVLVSTKWINTDTYSRTQWLAMVLMGASLPLIPWTTMDGTTINTTPTLATTVFNAVASQDATIFGVATAHYNAMMLLTDPTGYNFSANWPVTFTP